jgi:PhzF family phenazine biosynthesis protein
VKRDFRQVDVFGENSCTGNPLAVVLDAGGIDDESLRRFSVWSNLSECAFVLPPVRPEADYRVRIFSLETELPFAGHPTLGTACAWMDAGGEPRSPGLLVQECGLGLVKVCLDGRRLWFASPNRVRSGPVDAALLSQLISIIDIPASAVIDAEWLDNGPGWVGLLLDSVETLRSVRPDVSAHPGRWDIGLIASTGTANGVDDGVAFEVRAFFTDGREAIREDPVTGSLNASAAEWMIVTGRATAPFSMRQVSARGHRGRIYISSRDDQVWVGGTARIQVTGSVEL